MREHWGLGIGHMHAHNRPSRSSIYQLDETDDHDSQLAQMGSDEVFDLDFSVVDTEGMEVVSGQAEIQRGGK